MAQIFGYTRTGPKEVPLNQQQERILEYVAMKDLGSQMVWVGDTATSAKNSLFRRPVGRSIIRCCTPGDHLVCLKIGQAFRSLQECANQCKVFHRIGLIFHCVNHPLDQSTESLRRMLQSLLALQEASKHTDTMDEDAYSVTVRKQQTKTAGMIALDRIPIGWTRDRTRTGVKCHSSPKERREAEYIVSLLNEGLTPEEIVPRLRKEKIKRVASGAEWSASAIRRCRQAVARGYPGVSAELAANIHQQLKRDEAVVMANLYGLSDDSSPIPRD